MYINYITDKLDEGIYSISFTFNSLKNKYFLTYSLESGTFSREITREDFVRLGRDPYYYRELLLRFQ